MRAALACLSALGLLLSSAGASAFTHIVKPGETLAQIAERVYGDGRRETVLVGANALDVQGGTIISAGMRLEVPAPGHHTVMQGETWAELALSWLGTADMARTELLAHDNKGVPWVPPVEGQEIEIPAVITYIAGEADTVNTIAARFWGDPNRGWELNSYNRRQGVLVRRGEVVLVAMAGLRLTEAGRAEARAAAERDGASGGPGPRAAAQGRRRAAAAPHRRALRPVRGGCRARQPPARRRRPSRIRSWPCCIARSLEAYVALDARTAAAAACAAWKSNDPAWALDPVRTSPKIRAACDAR